jgi:hypothetical protein
MRRLREHRLPRAQSALFVSGVLLPSNCSAVACTNEVSIIRRQAPALRALALRRVARAAWCRRAGAAALLPVVLSSYW